MQSGVILPVVAPPSRGVTLVELLVVLVILGLVTGLSVLALPALRPGPEEEQAERIAHARAQAVVTGTEVVIALDSLPVRFLPDGRVLGGKIDPLTGATDAP